jgi:hypothetical protein
MVMGVGRRVAAERASTTCTGRGVGVSEVGKAKKKAPAPTVSKPQLSKSNNTTPPMIQKIALEGVLGSATIKCLFLRTLIEHKAQ